MKVLAEEHLYALDRLIPENYEVVTYNAEGGIPEDVTDYDAILIRTVTKINRDTLPHSGNLKFLGSAAAGFDHVDLNHLNSIGIHFARSEGCNANAVAEYLLTVLYKWGQLRLKQIGEMKIGVIGCGNTGGALIQYLEKLNIQYVPYDPPKAEREDTFVSATLDELLTSDVLSFHTPLNHSGPHATYHMCDKTWLSNGFKLVVNASRGGVVDEKALLEAKRLGFVRDFVIDVWEDEPLFSDRTAKEAIIATPHIAGYSREAKWKASEIVIRKLADFFGDDYTPKSLGESPPKTGHCDSENLDFAEFLWKYHKIDYYDQKLRELTGLTKEEKKQRFDDLRSNTPTRFEFKTVIDHSINSGKFPEEVDIF